MYIWAEKDLTKNFFVESLQNVAANPKVAEVAPLLSPKVLDPATYPPPDGLPTTLNEGVDREKLSRDSPVLVPDSKFQPVQVLHVVSDPKSH
jgi:hypothetical protein